MQSKDFTKKLEGFKLKLLPSTEKDRGALRNNYNSAVRFLKEQLESEGIERIRAIYSAILESISVVQIDVWDPTNGPKIFDGLNSSARTDDDWRSRPKNEIFSRVSSEDINVIEQIDEHK